MKAKSHRCFALLLIIVCFGCSHTRDAGVAVADFERRTVICRPIIRGPLRSSGGVLMVTADGEEPWMVGLDKDSYGRTNYFLVDASLAKRLSESEPYTFILGPIPDYPYLGRILEVHQGDNVIFDVMRRTKLNNALNGTSGVPADH